MESTNSYKKIKLIAWLQFIAVAASAVLAAIVASFLDVRIDLTEDKRFTLSEATKEILKDLKHDIYFQVYLDGDMPIPLKRLKRSVREILDEFRLVSDRKVDYEFINPSEGKDEKQRNATYEALIKKGLRQVNARSSDEEGGSTQKLIFPGMTANCNGVEQPVNFLQNNPSYNAEQNLLHSVEGLEYEIIQTISTISSDTVFRVAFIEGHGEYTEVEVADITLNLARFFSVDRGVIGGKNGILDNYAAIIIAGPESEFSEKDKFIIDQYIMNGGKVIWLVDEVRVNTDSLASGETVALYRPLGFEDQLFRYGVRINPVIVQDMDCMVIRLAVMSGGTRQQIVPAPWIYFPLLNPVYDNPVTRNINKVKGEFVNFLDTVGNDPKIKKKILLTTSAYSRIVSPPVIISLKEADIIPGQKEFNKSHLPVAVLLEGNFPSVFRNRLTGNLTDGKQIKPKDESIPSKVIVVSDGDVIRNDVSVRGQGETPYQLGTDRYTGEVYGNRDFIINCLNYLIDDKGIMELRSRELKLRLLDKNKIRQERYTWQFINTAGPLIIIVLGGLLYSFIRRRVFTKY